jgi:nucleoside-diphosphate-sugar epimerase
MTVLVTGSSGHLGEALVRTLAAARRHVIGTDIRPGPFTHRTGSITDRGFVRDCMDGVATVLHAATLHKPHVATHSRQDFVDVNITGTLNLQFLYRRVDIEDVVGAHVLAADRKPAGGFARYIISATTPFFRDEMAELRRNAPRVVARHVPVYEVEYATRGWRMFPGIDRVYVNAKARRELEWQPRHDFAALIARLASGGDIESELARAIGRKGYHNRLFRGGPYPI